MARKRSIDAYQFNRPLSSPTSKAVYICYGVHGRAYGGAPPFNSKIRILCMNETTLELCWAEGMYTPIDRFTCDSMRGVDGWGMLGWVMADGSLPLGEHDRVDPAMAQIKYLRRIDCRDVSLPHSANFDFELQGKVNREMREQSK